MRIRVDSSALILDPSTRRTCDFVLRCSWCQRIADAEGWLEVEDAVVRMEFFNQLPSPADSWYLLAAQRRILERTGGVNMSSERAQGAALYGSNGREQGRIHYDG